MCVDHQGGRPGLPPEDGLPLLHGNEGPVLWLVCAGGKVSPRLVKQNAFWIFRLGAFITICFACSLAHRCTRKQECGRPLENNTWLWSPDQQCVQMEAFDPPNLSCKKMQQVRDSLSEDVGRLTLQRRSWASLGMFHFMLLYDVSFDSFPA